MNSPRADQAVNQAVLSWKRFQLGLAGFVANATLLVLAGEYSRVLYYLLLILLLLSFGLAMWGYVGIFKSRFARLRAMRSKSNR